MLVNNGTPCDQTIFDVRTFSSFLCALAATLMLASPGHAFVANASDSSLSDPIAAAPTTARWNANSSSLVDSGERGLGGGLEFSLDDSFCTSLNFVDGSTCADIRALIIAAGEKWGQGNPNIYMVDVTDMITARLPGNFATNLELGAEINFFARSRAEMEDELERAAASAGTMVIDIKPQSTNGTTLWAAEGTLTHASIHFTTDHCYYLVTPVAPGVCMPFGLILLHEIGHALGLGHPDALRGWNLDTDDDPTNAMEIQCLNPMAGLRYAQNYDPNAVMIGTQTNDQNWDDAIKMDDYAGLDFLYPVCTEEELSDTASVVASGAEQPTLSVAVDANFYPIDSLIANEDGRVLLDLAIAPDRSVTSAEIHTSSGHGRLDDAALAIARSNRFDAGQNNASGNEAELVLAEIVWQLPLRPAFDIGMPSSGSEDLERPAQLVDTPANENLLRVPDRSAAAGEQGVVRVRAVVSGAGSILRAELVESSGYASLDDAAIALTNASRYEPAIRGGLPVEASLEMAFAYDTLPGKPSPRCYPYPTDINLPTIRMTYFSSSNIPDDENPSAERWVRVNDAGLVETMILATDLGWMHVDDVLKQRWAPSAAIPENHPPQNCWYYRPFFVPRP